MTERHPADIMSMFKTENLPLSVVHTINFFLFTALIWLSFFFHNGYQIYRPEALIAMAAFFAGICAVFLFLNFLRAGWVIYFLLAFLFMDLAYGTKLFFFTGLTGLSEANAAVMPILPRILRVAAHALIFPVLPVMTVFFLLRRKIPGVFLTVLAVMVLATLIMYLFRPSVLYKTETAKTGITKDLPNTVVILLDEHTGLEQLSEISGEALREKLIGQYTKNGFRVLGGAFSQYSRTRESVLSSHNFKVFGSLEAGDEKIIDSRLLNTAHEKGYRIHVYSSTWNDYCRENKVDKCFTFQHNALGLLQQQSLPVTDKLCVVLNYFVSAHKSRILKIALKRMEIYGWRTQDQLYPLSTGKVLDELARDMAAYPAGGFFYVHLLAPHSPYLYDAGCRIRPVREWRTSWPDVPEGNTPAQIRTKELLYLEQADCVQSKMADLFSMMKEKGLFRNSRIVVMGDHGHKIVSVEVHSDNGTGENPRALRGSFSAFLALKESGRDEATPGEYDKTSVSLTETLGDFFGLEPKSSREDIRKIYLRTKNPPYRYSAVEYPA